jgi:hypothetical protein
MAIGSREGDLGVICECGDCLAVAEEEAGRRIVCNCGRTVVVPTLEEFRVRPVLRSATTIEARIRGMIEDGELPQTSACGSCGEVNRRNVVEFEVECEKAQVRDGAPVGFFVLLVSAVLSFGLFLKLALLASAESGPGEILGRDYSVWLPMCLCRDCHLRLRSRGGRIGRVVAVGLFVIGLLIVYLQIFIGLGIVAVSIVLVIGNEYLVLKRRQRSLKHLLRTVPAYGQLLKKFPRAVIVLPQFGSEEDTKL